MATYTQGYQPYMPDWQPFTPDYKFLSDVLEVKTNRYNTNYKALNDLYSKVVYGDLSRKDTQDMRNQYAENLGKQLEMVSGMDLSVAQNVDAAKQLFKPFFEEDLIVKDLVFTKQYKDQMQYANMLMNSPDKDQREMYWQTGVKALEYQLEDFKNAAEDRALSMGTPRYVADADLYEKSIEFLKKSGLDVTQEYVDETGFWIVKDRNGNLITEQAFKMAQRALMDDPLVQQAYYTDAYVKSRDFAKAGMDAGRFANVDQGQAAWAQETITRVEAQIAARSIKEKDKVDKLKNANVNWDEYVKQQGVIPGSDEDKEYVTQKRSYEAALEGLKMTEETLKNSQGSPDQSTQGLLNRAYNLLMGYNLQDDLSAAAISYSNINKSRELKVNEYKKQQLQFQHDFSKMAMQHQYNLAMEDVKQRNRIELEKAKAQISDPFGSLLNQLFGTDPLTNKQGTEQVMIDPTTGKPVDPETADYLQITNAKVETLRQDVTERQVDLSLRALERLQPNANNYYVVNESIKGDLPTIKKLLMNPANAGAADDFYKRMANSFRDPKELMQQNPNFVKRNGGADYQTMAKEFDQVTSRRMQLDHVISTGNQVMYDNFLKVIKTDLTKETQMVRSELKTGTPSIFQNLSGGALDIKSEAEFITEYVNKAKSGKLKNPEPRTGFFSRGNGADENFMVTYDQYQTNQGMRKTAGGDFEYPKKRVTEFSLSKATESAKEAYARQKSLINNTLNGTLETVAEQEGLKTNANVRMFQPWDPYQYMRGKSLEQMETGDALKTPYYQTEVDPVTMRKDIGQIQALSDLINQVKRTPSQSLIFTAGDVGTMSSDDVNMNTNNPKAKEIYNLWVQDMARFRDPKASKTNMPNVTIGYAPSYGPTGEETLGKDKAAYVLSFSPEWLKSLQGTANKPGIIGEKELQTYSQITISFPQSEDINPRKSGEFNFSAVRNEVMYSPQKQMVKSVDGGGSLRVYPDANSNFIAEIRPLQYNPQTGNFDDAGILRYNLTDQMNQANESIGYIDELVSVYYGNLEAVGRQNNQDQSNNKKVKAKK